MAALNNVEVNVCLLIVIPFGVGYTVGYSFIIATKVKSHELDRFVCFACLEYPLHAYLLFNAFYFTCF